MSEGDPISRAILSIYVADTANRRDWHAIRRRESQPPTNGRLKQARPNMQTQTSHHDASTLFGTDAGPGEILEAVGALRQYMRSMDAQVKELLSERARLNAEVDRLRAERQQARRSAGPVRGRSLDSEPARTSDFCSEAHRVTDELDQLARLYETAARHRTRARRSSAPPLSEAPAGEGGAWLKKMFLFLMMSELV